MGGESTADALASACRGGGPPLQDIGALRKSGAALNSKANPATYAASKVPFKRAGIVWRSPSEVGSVVFLKFEFWHGINNY